MNKENMNNVAIVDLERYENLIRVSDGRRLEIAHLNDLVDRMASDIRTLEDYIMKSNYCTWEHNSVEPQDCFTNYYKMLDLSITKERMSDFIKKKREENKENEDE